MAAMTMYIVFAFIVAILLGGSPIASAQVSSGDPAAAQQNAAKHPTDNAGQNSASKPSRDAPASGR
jgi:hypothetical protein